MTDRKALTERRVKLLLLKEQIKNAILTLLFVSMAALACVYIVRTQRLTLESPASVDIDRMLTLRSGGEGFVSGFSAERVLPECVAVKSGGSGRAVMGGRSVIAGALALLSEPLRSAFGEGSELTEAPPDDADAVWLSCCAASDSVYIRFRSPLPAPVIAMYLSGGTDASSVAGFSTAGDIRYISEIFLLPGDPTGGDGDSGGRYFRAVARDGDGAVLRISGRDMIIDMDAAVSYSRNAEFSDFAFAGDESAKKPELKMTPEPSAVETFGETPRLCASFAADTLARLKNAPEPVLRLFGYNTSRLVSYDEPDTGASVYVETFGTLRITSGSIVFSASGERGGIDVSTWLPYGRAGGAYSIYELLYCCENLIAGLSAAEPSVSGGDAQLYLRDVYNGADGTVNIEYRYIFDGVDIDAPGYGVLISISGGMIKGVSVSPITAVNQLTRLLNLSMERALGGHPSAGAGDGGRISLIYVPDFAGGSSSSAQWAYRVSKDNITEQTAETSQTDENGAEDTPDPASETAENAENGGEA